MNLLPKFKAAVDDRAHRAVHYSNQALMLAERGKVAAAIALYHRAMALNPTDARICNSLASLLATEGRLGDAEDLIRSGDYVADVATAFVLLGRHDLKGALRSFREADAKHPSGAAQRMGPATALLLQGAWAEGWDAYETTLAHNHTIATPRWDGRHVRHLVVMAEQGIGDIIQFARYIPWAANRVDRVTFKTRPNLCWLMRGYGKVSKVVPDTQEVPADAAIGLIGLAKLHGTLPNNIPKDPGFLMPEPFSLPNTDTLKVGIVWAGNTEYARDRQRSMTLEQMLPLANDRKVLIYSIQVGVKSAEIAQAGAQLLVTDLSGIASLDWAHCAGILMAMDVVVTVDTAVAHLAGALGVRTFLCLPWVPDWRWMLDSLTTPWYPSMALFRQQKFGDWAGVINRVAEALKCVKQR